MCVILRGIALDSDQSNGKSVGKVPTDFLHICMHIKRLLLCLSSYLTKTKAITYRPSPHIIRPYNLQAILILFQPDSKSQVSKSHFLADKTNRYTATGMQV